MTKHNLTLDYLSEATVADLSALEVSALVCLDLQVENLKATLKEHQDKLTATYERKFGERAKALLGDKGQDTGTVHVDLDGWDVAVTVPKKVEWDQEKLKTALNGMSPDDAKHYAKVTVAVEERKYTAAPPAVQKALADARTTKPGKAAYSFKKIEQEAA